MASRLDETEEHLSTPRGNPKVPRDVWDDTQGTTKWRPELYDIRLKLG
jgi:hypothetical protein